MAAGINSLVRRVATKSAFESAKEVVGDASTWNQGDFLSWDSTNHVITTTKALADDGTHFLGIAAQSAVSGVQVGPYPGLTDVTEGISDLKGPEYGDIHTVLAKDGDTFTQGAEVFPDNTSSTRMVTTATGLQAIGIYQGPTITAGASTSIEILVGCQFPNNTLKL